MSTPPNTPTNTPTNTMDALGPFPELKTTAPNKDTERRLIPRVKMAGAFTATFEASDTAPSALAVIELKDGSPRGISANAPFPVQPGVRVKLFSAGSRVALHTGTVVRCEQETTEVDGSPLPRPRHVLAIMFDSRS